MVRLTRIYTRTGDGGQTRLVGGQEVSKDDLRIEAYGTVDELNAVMGLVRAELKRSELPVGPLLKWIAHTQHKLFDLGSDLATRIEDRWEGQPLIMDADIKALEELMDSLNKELEPLKSFVLPGGGPISAFLHQARTVARRAERIIVATGRHEALGEHVLAYVNRLSDALFVWSRWAAKHLGECEILWEPG